MHDAPTLAVFCVDAADLTEAEIAFLLPWLSEEKQQRLPRMKPLAKKVSIAGEYLLRYGLWKTFGIAPKDIRTQTDALGKPQLLSHPHLHFNISHSGSCCACAVGDIPVGIDLQVRKPIRHALLAERTFLPKEQALYRELGGTQEAFYRIWARKEAISKLTGEGLRTLGRAEVPAHTIFLEQVWQDCALCAVSAPWKAFPNR